MYNPKYGRIAALRIVHINARPDIHEYFFAPLRERSKNNGVAAYGRNKPEAATHDVLTF